MVLWIKVNAFFEIFIRKLDIFLFLLSIQECLEVSGGEQTYCSLIDIRQNKKIGKFTVTCLEKKWVGIYFFI